MNENHSDRLKRIETVSRIVRYIVLALLCLSAGNWLVSMIWRSPGTWVQRTPEQIFGFLMQVVLWFGIRR